MSTIEASYDTLLRQASDTADTYLGKATRNIDKEFGDGYAHAHPDLVGQMILASAIDFATAAFAKTIGELNDTIRDKGLND